LGRNPTSARRRTPRGAPAPQAIALAALGALACLAGCGGGGDPQEADVPEGDFPVTVTRASFPPDQRLADATFLQLAVRNEGREAVPNLAVTIFVDGGASGPFSIRIDQPDLANPNRPAWILEDGYPKVVKPGESLAGLDREPPGGAEAAQTNTFAFGSLAPGQTRRMAWRVTPVIAGAYRVHYQVDASLTGRARATSDGEPVRGAFPVEISGETPRVRVTGSGKVVIER
jgi:hypothetical protein